MAKKTKPKAAATLEPPSTPTPLPEAKWVSSTLIFLTLGEIRPGPNVRARESYGEKELEEMAATIVEEGLLQPLVGRQVDNGVYEYVFGGRRYYALQKLAQRGQIDSTYAVPFTVREISDAQAVTLGIIENTQRQEMTPLQEADAYAKALQEGLSEADIAAKTGKSVEAVRKRVALATRLAPEMRKKLEAREIGLGAAQAATGLTLDQQREFLKGQGRWGWDENHIRSFARKSTFDPAKAIFTKEQAAARGLTLTTPDLFGVLKPAYTDPAKALNLQLDAAKIKVENLKKKWAGAHLVVLKPSDYDSSALAKIGLERYQQTKDKALGHAAVVVNTDGSVEVLEGLLPKKTAKGTAEPGVAQAKPITHLTQGSALAAKTVKVQALQVMALELDDRKLLELMAYSLLGVQGIAVDTSRAYSSLDVHPTVQERSKLLKGFNRGKEGQPGFADPYRQNQTKVFEQIAALTDAELREFVRLQLAYALGGRNEGNHDVNSPRLRDWAPALADHWGAEGQQLELRRAAITHDWLKGLQTARLQQIHNELKGGSGRETLTKKELVNSIMGLLPGNPTWLPSELKFAQAIQPNEEEETLHQTMLKRSTELILEDNSSLYLNVESEMLVIRNEAEIVVSLTSGDVAALVSNLRERAAEVEEEDDDLILWGHQPPLYQADAIALAETLEEFLEELEDNELEEGDDEE